MATSPESPPKPNRNRLAGFLRPFVTRALHNCLTLSLRPFASLRVNSAKQSRINAINKMRLLRSSSTPSQ